MCVRDSGREDKSTTPLVRHSISSPASDTGCAGQKNPSECVELNETDRQSLYRCPERLNYNRLSQAGSSTYTQFLKFSNHRSEPMLATTSNKVLKNSA